MKQSDVIQAMGFLEGKTSNDKSMVSTGVCLTSSGKIIARWNPTQDRLIFPLFSKAALSKQDVRRRNMVLRMAQTKGIKCILSK